MQEWRFLSSFFEPRQVSANEGIAQHVADRRQYVCGGGTTQVAAEGDQGSKLAARLVLEKARGRADERLPEESQRVVFVDVLLETEHLQVAKQRLGITGQAAFLGVRFHHEIEPAALEIKF